MLDTISLSDLIDIVKWLSSLPPSILLWGPAEPSFLLFIFFSFYRNEPWSQISKALNGFTLLKSTNSGGCRKTLTTSKNKNSWTKGISSEAITSKKSNYLILVNLTLKRTTLCQTMFCKNKHILKTPYCILMHLLPRKGLFTLVLNLGGERGTVKMEAKVANCRRKHVQNHTSKKPSIFFWEWNFKTNSC